jgi:hypothetical protein
MDTPNWIAASMEWLSDALAFVWLLLMETWDAVQEWAFGQEHRFDLLTVWALAVGMTYLAYSKRETWSVIRKQHDRTRVGMAMKSQKLSEAILFACIGILYGATLFLYYMADDPLGFWGRMAIRGILIASIVAAVWYGRRFRLALKEENWGQPDPEPSKSRLTDIGDRRRRMVSNERQHRV